MTTFLLILMALLLIAALERANRRQSPKPRGLNGSYDSDDRDWARIKLDLLALGDTGRAGTPTTTTVRARLDRLRRPSSRSPDRLSRPPSDNSPQWTRLLP